jgi:gliding motility-associated-like protein
VASTTEQFTVNGAYPKAQLAFNNGDSLCSTNAFALTNKSTVNFGSITKLKIYWDYGNDSANEITDDSTQIGKQYQTRYPAFDNPAIKTYSIKYVAYSGITCVSELDTVVTLKASPVVVFDTIGPVCAGAGAFTLTQAKETGGLDGTGVYSGSGVASAGLFNPGQAALGTDSIYYTFTAGNGCRASVGQTVKVYEQPTADAGPDMHLLQGGSVTINATAGGDSLYYVWAPDMYLSDNTVLTPTASPPVDVTYTLTVTASDGCSAEDSMHISLVKTPLVPNAFSPNGDGINDTWVINYLNSYHNLTVQVFNRYGQVVFFSNGYSNAWDGTSNGKPLPAGTYYYIIDRKVAGQGKLTGWVEIIR